MDDFIIQHPLGVALLGLEWGQGSKMGPRLEGLCGTETHTGTAVGLLDWKAAMHQHIRRKTGKATLRLTQPLHLTLSDLCHHLLYYQGRETEKEGPHEGKREADRARQYKASNSAFSLVATAQ